MAAPKAPTDAESKKDPLYDLRPPNSDEITFLTYIQENVGKDRLLILHDILLQDEDLTDKIGWDLVATLLPLLPESEECLMTVARLGNPKETVLKVSIALRELAFPDDDDEEAEEEGEEEDEEAKDEVPLPVTQFGVLLRMLPLLHCRITGNFPSRFLSVTLQAVLAAFSNAPSCYDELTSNIATFIKTMTGTRRPHLPPRRSSTVHLTSGPTDDLARAPSPLPTSPETAEEGIMHRLMQSFLTHVLDDYMQRAPPVDGVSGLAWCSRYMEKVRHPLLVPEPVSMTDRFSHSDALETRLTTVGILVALAQDLSIGSVEILEDLEDDRPEVWGDRGEEHEAPMRASDIPLSRMGSLYLLTARRAMEVVLDGPAATPAIPIFPTHSSVLQNVLSFEVEKPDSMIDALLFHGLVALETNSIGTAAMDVYRNYLNQVFLLAATGSPPLAQFAHHLGTEVLYRHPNEIFRFLYIQDTLDHCPMPSVKAFAVQWTKRELLLANDKPPAAEDEPEDLFAKSLPLFALSSCFFPDLSNAYSDVGGDGEGTFEAIRANYGFYTASANFLYFLVLRRSLHHPLELRAVLEDSDCAKNFVEPLLRAVIAFKAELDQSEQDGMPLSVLEMVLKDVVRQLKGLGWCSMN
jgi:hypothetical protein